MATAQSYKTVEYILTLSDEEARFIVGFCQDSIAWQSETTTNKRIRESIFKALQKELDN